MKSFSWKDGSPGKPDSMVRKVWDNRTKIENMTSEDASKFLQIQRGTFINIASSLNLKFKKEHGGGRKLSKTHRQAIAENNGYEDFKAMMTDCIIIRGESVPDFSKKHGLWGVTIYNLLKEYDLHEAYLENRGPEGKKRILSRVKSEKPIKKTLRHKGQGQIYDPFQGILPSNEG